MSNRVKSFGGMKQNEDGGVVTESGNYVTCTPARATSLQLMEMQGSHEVNCCFVFCMLMKETDIDHSLFCLQADFYTNQFRETRTNIIF